jgi:lipoate-protein ligase B
MNSIVKFLDTVDYSEAETLQKSARASLAGPGSPGQIFILQHSPPVITLGRHRGGSSIVSGADIINSSGYRIVRSSRGGDATIHEPGQAVIYYIMKVSSKNASEFVINRSLEIASYIRSEYGLDINYNRDHPGLWIADRKIGSVGFDLTGGISSHGIAVNVNNSLDGFRHIIPCGNAETVMTSIAAETGSEVSFKIFCLGLQMHLESIHG